MKRLFYLLLFMFFLIFSISYANEKYISGKITKLVAENTKNLDEGISKILTYEIEILEGNEKGKIVEIDFPIYKEKQYNIFAKVGDKVVLYKSFDEVVDVENKSSYLKERIDISDIDKRNSFYILASIFFGATILIARKKGLYAALSLFLSITFIIKIFIPAISKGYSPILFAVITCIFSTIVTTFLIGGISKKSLIAILGTTSGVLVSGILSFSFANIMRLTGYDDPEILSYANLISNINLKELVSAGIIIGSLGAVMDVAVSISSSIDELYKNSLSIDSKSLFISSMNIGKDIIGTMINTLILAYIGSSMLTILLVYLQSSQYPAIRVLNYENIAVEILRAVCGSIGILVSVPLTSYIGSKIYRVKIMKK